VFDFLNAVYGKFGFAFKLELSTRPDKYLGEIETWNEAEKVSSACALAVPPLVHASRAAPLVGARQVHAGQVGAEPGRRCLLRPQDRHHHLRCDEARVPVVGDATKPLAGCADAVSAAPRSSSTSSCRSASSCRTARPPATQPSAATSTGLSWCVARLAPWQLAADAHSYRSTAPSSARSSGSSAS
jgi:hypothetical protein